MENNWTYLKTLILIGLCCLAFLASCSNDFTKGRDYYKEKKFSMARHYLNKIKNSPKFADSVNLIIERMDAIDDSTNLENDKEIYHLALEHFNKKEYTKTRLTLGKINIEYIRPSVYVDSAKVIRKLAIRKIEEAKEEYSRTLKLMTGKKYVPPFSIDLISKYGSPKTLTGTNNIDWIVYFPKGKFTLVVNKKSNRISFIKEGMHPNLRKPIDVIKETRILYNELMSFKNSNSFKQYGFMQGYKYYDWMQRVDRFDKYSESKELLNKGVVLGDLRMLGMEYVSSKGKETEYSRITRANFIKALK